MTAQEKVTTSYNTYHIRGIDIKIPRHIKFCDVIASDNNVTLICKNAKEMKTTKDTLYIQTIDLSDHTPVWNPKCVLSVKRPKYVKGTYHSSFSPDGSKLAFGLVYRTKRNENERFAFIVIDNKGNILNKKEIQKTHFETHVDCYEYFGVTDSGVVYVGYVDDEPEQLKITAPYILRLYSIDGDNISLYTKGVQFSRYHTIGQVSQNDFIIMGDVYSKYEICIFDSNQKAFNSIIYDTSKEGRMASSSFAKMSSESSPKKYCNVKLMGLYKISSNSYITISEAEGSSWQVSTQKQVYSYTDNTGIHQGTRNVEVTSNRHKYAGDILIVQFNEDMGFENSYIIKRFQVDKDLWLNIKTGAKITLQYYDGDNKTTVTIEADEQNKLVFTGGNVVHIEQETQDKDSEDFNTLDESPEFDD